MSVDRCRHCGAVIEPMTDGGWNHEADGWVLCVGNVGIAEPENKEDEAE